jgi:hypothetical protein
VLAVLDRHGLVMPRHPRRYWATGTALSQPTQPNAPWCPSEGYVCARQAVGVRQVDDHIWLVTFMHDDLGYFDDRPVASGRSGNPFRARVLPMCPE